MYFLWSPENKIDFAISSMLSIWGRVDANRCNFSFLRDKLDFLSPFKRKLNSELNAFINGSIS